MSQLKMVRQKSLLDELLLNFLSKVQNLTVFSIIYMIRIRFFGPRARLVSLLECVGLVGCRVTVFFGLGAASNPQPLDRSQHGCTVGPGPTRVAPPPRQGGGGTRAPALTYVSAGAGVIVLVVVLCRGGITVQNCLSSAARELFQRISGGTVQIAMVTSG